MTLKMKMFYEEILSNCEIEAIALKPPALPSWPVTHGGKKV
jgi:hypothetical protein